VLGGNSGDASFEITVNNLLLTRRNQEVGGRKAIKKRLQKTYSLTEGGDRKGKTSLSQSGSIDT